MRRLLLACLGPALLAAAPKDLPQPGRDAAFLARVLPVAEAAPDRPWRIYREPPVSASAVVEVVGELTAEELRQAKFEEFLAWFREDLRQFLKAHLDGGDFLADAAVPAAGPGPRMVRLGGARF